MPPPAISVEKQEELILFFTELRYWWNRGDLEHKLWYRMKQKAQELGFSVESAKNIIRYARDVGAVDRRLTGD